MFVRPGARFVPFGKYARTSATSSGLVSPQEDEARIVACDLGGGTGSIRVVTQTSSPAGESVKPLTVVIYSDDRTVRAQLQRILGKRPAIDLAPVQYVECATQAALLKVMDAGGVDIAILDAEATPSGGMGLCRQLKDEIYRCPPIALLVARPQDAWLATWSKADAVVPQPMDPIATPEIIAGLLRERVAGVPA